MKRKTCTKPSAGWSAGLPVSTGARRPQSNLPPLQKSELLSYGGACLVKVIVQNVRGAISVLFPNQQRNFQDGQHLCRCLPAESGRNSPHLQQLSGKTRI